MAKRKDDQMRTALAVSIMAVALISAGFFLALGNQIIGPGGFTEGVGALPDLEITFDFENPRWTDYSPVGTKETGAGSTITLKADWTDDIGFAEASLYTNESGTMEKVETVILEGNESTSSFSFKAANLADWTVEWKITAVDTVGKTNSTPTGIITTKDVTGPQCTLSQGSDTPEVGAMNTLTAFCTDKSGVKTVSLIMDEGGIFAEISDKYDSPATVDGASASAEFKWINPDIGKGTAVNWNVRATDTEGNSKESAVLNFVVGGAADIVPPTLASSPEFATSSPYIGTPVNVKVSLSDNTALKRTWLSVSGVEVSSKDLSGTSDEGTLSWTAAGTGDVKWRIFVEDEAGNVYSSEEFTFTVLAAPPEIQCDPAGKPDEKRGICRDIGGGVFEQTVVAYTCDTSTGVWTQQVISEDCTTEVPAFAPLSLITAIIIILVGLSATYFLVLRKPAPKTGKL